MGTGCLIVADGHTVMHGYVLHNAMRPFAGAHTFRLGVSLHSDGHSHNVEVTQMQIVGTEIEGTKPGTAVQLQGREVEHGPFSGIAHETGPPLFRTTFLQSKDIGHETHVLHDLPVGDVVGSATEIDRVAWCDHSVGTGKGGKRVGEGATCLVVARGCNKDGLGRSCLNQGRQHDGKK